MPQPDRILLVVSILEGRNFPNQSSCQLTVDAKFDGEILVTDPVEFSSTPDINQELAWELDKKTFQQHKLQRSVIKCNAYATTSPGVRDNLGYFMIDVRPLSTTQTIRWHRLLQTKYPKLKPEFSICAYIEDDQATKSTITTATTTTTTASKISKTSTNTTSARSKHLQPVLLEDKGYYQLGADISSAEIFSLSITTCSAKNLIHLMLSNTNITNQDGYFFYYTLFGNKIITEKFHDLIQPEFNPERASVRIRTSIQLLRSYFETFHPIEFCLLSGNDIIGQTQVPLHKIVKPLQQKSGMDKIFDVLTEEFNLRLSPSKDNEKIKMTEDENSQSFVKIIVKLTRETSVNEQKPNNEKQNRTRSNSVNNHNSNTTLIDHDNSIRQRVQQISINNHATTDDRLPTLMFDNSNDHHLTHHYCLSIDLKSLRNLRLSNSTYLYCRYVYPFLGTSTPILTHPPLHIPYTSSAPPNEHQLPHGLCIFNFAVNAEQLTTHFHREPLTIEVYCRDQERSERKDQLFGIVRLQLEKVLQVEKQRCSSNVNGILGWRQTWTQALPVIGTNTEKCAELLVTVVIEDLGTLQLNSTATPRPQSVPPQHLDLNNVFQRPSEDAQLQAAYELQLWKESKELEFEKHLREIEAKKLYELMEAFKEKDRERESLLQKKMKEYGELEKQMKRALADIEKREKQLNTNEQEIQRMQIDLKRDYDNKHIEIREASKRLQEQSEHTITLEKSKNQALDDEIIRLKRSLAEWEKRYRDKEQEYFSYKEKQRSAPEVKLQAEINMLTLEKNELQRKLDASLTSADRYKQQWLKALKEYQRLKQREQDQSKVLLQKQQQELEHMRLRYLAAEENDIMKNDHKQLESIKNELNKLRDVSTTPTISGGLQTNSTLSDDNDHLEQVDQQLGVLIEHRDTLLQTGTYTHSDALIQELERRIQEAMKRKSSSSRH
ncbi:unnamed protein product [Adineta steineri]|uniref:C2 domain-containing protein n=2 Tax=Adineta steineri TaxID=433720 RepID=A0A814XGE0_9BILA|nr:unnamed protein product [Adineta steineri]CAF3653756.1 unnamed protein product [Adineta steineri]